MIGWDCDFIVSWCWRKGKIGRSVWYWAGEFITGWRLRLIARLGFGILLLCMEVRVLIVLIIVMMFGIIIFWIIYGVKDFLLDRNSDLWDDGSTLWRIITTLFFYLEDICKDYFWWLWMWWIRLMIYCFIMILMLFMMVLGCYLWKIFGFIMLRIVSGSISSFYVRCVLVLW